VKNSRSIQTPNMINPCMLAFIPRKSMIKLLKIKDKEKIKKAARCGEKKKDITFKGATRRIRKMEEEEEWDNILKTLNKNNSQF